MTVKELKDKLSAMPDHFDVFLADRKSEFTYGLLNTVSTKEITFTDEPDGDPLSVDTVVILDEE